MPEIAKQNMKPQPPDVKLYRESVSDPVGGRFGKSEVERAAGRVINYLRQRGTGWAPIDLRDYALFCVQHGWDTNDSLYGLLGSWMDEYTWYPDPGYFVQIYHSYSITTQFIERFL